MNEMSDDLLRQLWRDAGGKFHGPNVETGTMPESKLLPFIRSALNALLLADSLARAVEQISVTSSHTRTEVTGLFEAGFPLKAYQAARPLAWPDREAMKKFLPMRRDITTEHLARMAGIPVKLAAAIGRLCKEMGNPAALWTEYDTIEEALIDEACRRIRLHPKNVETPFGTVQADGKVTP